MIPGEITDNLPFQIRSSHPLGGGSINNVFRLDTNRGEYCLKFNYADRYPGMFETEAAGLSLLSAAGEIRVPRVIQSESLNTNSYLLLEYIRPSRPGSLFMTEFGQSLARIHRNGNAKFGLDHDNYMGSLHQSNKLNDNWIAFFIEERLRKQVNLANSRGLLTSNQINLFERLFGRLENLLPSEKPALLHGDLWSGNYIISETGHPCLIDPAVYYGHREIDIAMTTLFGGFDKTFYTGYNEVWPLESGWEERLGVYNLYPLLIHLNLFGTVYLGSILSTISRFV